MTIREKIIRNYIDGYNQFDIKKMIADFDEDIVFENIQNNKINMSLEGLKAFKEQAQQAVSYFKTRTQTIQSFKHFENETEIEIDYYAILGMDFPNGLKTGQEINLKGKSIFKFSGNSIVRLSDIS